MTVVLKIAAALVLVAAVAGCSTNPATSVDSNGATLNADGNCATGLKGWWVYQIRDINANQGFKTVGPQHDFACNSNTGTVALESYRVTGLGSGRPYDYRIYANWYTPSDRSWHTGAFDANGSANSNYDSFTTPDVAQVDASASSPERFVAPPDGISVAAGSGCKVKEITNPRQLKSRPFGTHLGTIRLTTAWQYCPNGTIRKMYSAGADCSITDAGRVAGWSCGPIAKIRAISTGGSPEHGAYTYSYIFDWVSPIWGDVLKSQKRWCATNQISGSGAHRRHGSCEIQPW